jgi:hypothetical protein
VAFLQGKDRVAVASEVGAKGSEVEAPEVVGAVGEVGEGAGEEVGDAAPVAAAGVDQRGVQLDERLEEVAGRSGRLAPQLLPRLVRVPITPLPVEPEALQVARIIASQVVTP